MRVRTANGKALLSWITCLQIRVLVPSDFLLWISAVIISEPQFTYYDLRYLLAGAHVEMPNVECRHGVLQILSFISYGASPCLSRCVAHFTVPLNLSRSQVNCGSTQHLHRSDSAFYLEPAFGCVQNHLRFPLRLSLFFASWLRGEHYSERAHCPRMFSFSQVPSCLDKLLQHVSPM